nr:G patch domain and ankyrin repeats containing [Hymenolepis microstoma]
MVDKLLLRKHFVPASHVDECHHKNPREQERSLSSVNGEEVRDFYLSLFDKKEIVPSKNHPPHLQSSITCSGQCDPCSKAHFSSLLHQASILSQEPPRLSPILIPPSNPGYKILSRLGWSDPADSITSLDSSDGSANYLGGLGRQGQGRRLPIPTVLKRDRSGIGAVTKSHPRITHFSPHDTRAVENRHASRCLDQPLKLDKRYREKIIKVGKRKEIRFRMEFRFDDDQLRLLYGEHGCHL